MNYKGKLLLIMPFFYNYHNFIRDEMVKNGYEVTCISDEPIFPLYNILQRTPLNGFIIRKYWNRFLKSNSISFDKIIVIKGTSLREYDIKKIFKKNSNASTLYYLWDSVQNTKSYLNISPFFDKVYSFDSEDCKRYEGLVFLPLFFMPSYNFNEKIGYDVSFIGSVHDDRLRLLLSFKQFFDAYNIKYFFYIYMRRLQKIKYLMNSYKEYSGLKEFIHTSKLGYSNVMNIFDRSRVVIDINNSKQTGLTSRTFESLSKNKKLVTTNKFIKEYGFYSKDILVVDRALNINIDRDFFMTQCDSDFDMSEYTLENWTINILSGIK